MKEIDLLIDCCKYVDSLNQDLDQTQELSSDLKEIFLEKISNSLSLLESAQDFSEKSKEVALLLTGFERKVGTSLNLFAKHLLISQFPAVPKEDPAAVVIGVAEEKYVQKSFALDAARLAKKKFEKKSNKVVQDLWFRIAERELTLKAEKWTFGLFEGDKLTGDEMWNLNEQIVTYQNTLSTIVRYLNTLDETVRKLEKSLETQTNQLQSLRVCLQN